MTLNEYLEAIRKQSGAETGGINFTNPSYLSFDFSFCPEDYEDCTPESAGFDATRELMADLAEPEKFIQAAITHIRNELQRPRADRRRIFAVDTNGEYMTLEDWKRSIPND